MRAPSQSIFRSGGRSLVGRLGQAIVAVLLLASALVGLEASRRVSAGHHDVLRLHESWSERHARYGRIGRLALALSAPCNEVFDSGDLPGETARSQRARAAYQAEMDTARRELSTTSPAETRARLLADLESVRGAVDTLALDVDRTFTSYGVGTAPEVAVLDRHLALVGEALDRLGSSAREAEARETGARLATAAALPRFAGLLALIAALGFVFLPLLDRAPRAVPMSAESEAPEPAAPTPAPVAMAAPRATIRSQTHESAAPEAPLLDQLTGLIRQVEQREPAMLCMVLILDPGQTRLRVGSAPSLEEELGQSIERGAIGPSACSWGAAAHTRQRVLVEDTATHPLWLDFRRLAVRHGLRSSFAEPILSSAGHALGVFMSFRRRVHKPDAAEIELVSSAARMAGIAIERARAAEILKGMPGAPILGTPSLPETGIDRAAA